MSKKVFAAETHELDDHAISWFGLCPWSRTACFGTEDGHFGIVAKRHQYKARHKVRFHRGAGEPVNGVAFLEDIVMFTSRSAMIAVRRDGTGRDRLNTRHVEIDYGSHGVVGLPAARSFLSAHGHDGLVLAMPREGGVDTKQIIAPEFDFQQVLSLGSPWGPDVIAAACGTRGVVGFRFDRGQKDIPIHVRTGEGSDVAVIAKVGHPDLPYAVVAVDADGTISFLDDVLGGGGVHQITPPYPIGVVYEAIVSSGHLFILTSTHLHCVPDLVKKVLARAESFNGFGFECDASDLLPVGKRSFALIGGSTADVIEFEADRLVRQAAESKATVRGRKRPSGRPVSLIKRVTDIDLTTDTPVWESFHNKIVSSDSTSLVAAV